jgi:hypothetical protein
MNPKLIALAVIIALACYGTWYATSDHYERLAAEKQVESDKAVQAQVETTLALIAVDTAKQKAAEEQHAKDQIAINRQYSVTISLRDAFASSCGTVSTTGQASADPNGRSGVLQDSVGSLFAEFQAEVERTIIQRCDQLNLDSRQRNDEVR